MPTNDAASLAIFDHDGVLVDTLACTRQAWVELGRRSGLGITPEFIHETFGMTNPSILRLAAGRGDHRGRDRRATPTSRKNATADRRGAGSC